MDNIYKNKYLKYKTKYLELKNQLGGTENNLWNLKPAKINVDVIKFILKWNTLFYIFMYTFDVPKLSRDMFNETGIPADKLRLFNYWLNKFNFSIDYPSKNHREGIFFIKLSEHLQLPHFTGCDTATARGKRLDINWHFTYETGVQKNYNENDIPLIIIKIEELSNFEDKIKFLSALNLVQLSYEMVCKNALLFYIFYNQVILGEKLDDLKRTLLEQNLAHRYFAPFFSKTEISIVEQYKHYTGSFDLSISIAQKHREFENLFISKIKQYLASENVNEKLETEEKAKQKRQEKKEENEAVKIEAEKRKKESPEGILKQMKEELQNLNLQLRDLRERKKTVSTKEIDKSIEELQKELSRAEEKLKKENKALEELDESLQGTRGSKKGDKTKELIKGKNKEIKDTEEHIKEINIKIEKSKEQKVSKEREKESIQSEIVRLEGIYKVLVGQITEQTAIVEAKPTAETVVEQLLKTTESEIDSSVKENWDD
jgi:hypothetical protein